MNIATILVPMVTTTIVVGAAILVGKYLKRRGEPKKPADYRQLAKDINARYPKTMDELHRREQFGRARVNPPVSRVTPRPSPPAPMSGRTTDYAQRNNDTDDYLRNQMMIYSSTPSSSPSCDSPSSSSSYDSGSSSSSDSGGSCGGGD